MSKPILWILLALIPGLLGCSSGQDKTFIEADIKKVESSFGLEEGLKEKFELVSPEPEKKPEVEASKEETAKVASEETKEQKKELKPAAKKVVKKTLIKRKKVRRPKKKTSKSYPKVFKEYDKNSKGTWEVFKPKIYVGEEYLFRVSYLGITAGRIKLRTLPVVKIGKEQAFHFRAQLRSARFYSAIYSLDDSLDSFVQVDNFLPLKYVLKQKESVQEVDDLQLFDQQELKTFFWYKRIKRGVLKEEHKVESIPYYFQDSFSALHFVRGLPLKVGDIYEFPIMTRAKLWMLKIEVDREEILEVDSEEVQALKLKAETRFPGVLKKRGDINFWYSNDEEKRLLKFQAEVKIGSIAGELEEYTPGEKLEIK